MEEKVRQTKQNQKAMKNESPSAVKFSCRYCSRQVCTGEDVQIIENMNRVNVTPEFRYETQFRTDSISVCLLLSVYVL